MLLQDNAHGYSPVGGVLQRLQNCVVGDDVNLEIDRIRGCFELIEARRPAVARFDEDPGYHAGTAGRWRGDGRRRGGRVEARQPEAGGKRENEQHTEDEETPEASPVALRLSYGLGSLAHVLIRSYGYASRAAHVLDA